MNKKRKNRYSFWECFNQTLNKFIAAENKIRTNKNSADFILNKKQVLSRVNWEKFLWRIWKIKVDLHSANFSRANDTFRWRMHSFQSQSEANEILIIYKATCFKLKADHNKKCWKLKTFSISEVATRGVLLLKISSISLENTCIS